MMHDSCPFCGSYDLTYKYKRVQTPCLPSRPVTSAWMECEICGARGPESTYADKTFFYTVHTDKSDPVVIANEMWNTRHRPEVIERETTMEMKL